MATIKFNYKIDGWFDTVNYYRSETPMNINSMPPPLVTGITGLTYSDTTAESGKYYFVRFGSVNGAEEKISEEIEVSTASNYTNDFKSLDGITVFADSPYIATVDSVNGGLTLGATTAKSIVCRFDDVVFNDFEATFNITLNGSVFWIGGGLVFRTTNWDSAVGKLGYLAGIAKTQSFINKGTNSATASETVINANYNVSHLAGQKYNIKVRATGSTYQLFVDDALEVTATDASFTNGELGFRVWTDGDASVKFENLIINKL